VHGLRIPFGGHVLSLNQALILTFAVKSEAGRRDGARLACSISNIAALLKSLSPAGSKLSPMVAISVQGLLYSSGVALGGVNLFGAVLASALLSLWAFFHPLLTAFVIFGSGLFEAIEKLWRGLADTLGFDPSWGLWILGTVIAIKLFLAVAVALVGWFSSQAFEARYLEYLKKRGQDFRRPDPVCRAPAEGALRDLLNPLFVISFAISVGFFLLAKSTSASETALYVIRVTASGFVLFWAARAFSNLIPDLKKLGGDADGDLGRIVSAERKPDRAAQTGEQLIGNSAGLELRADLDPLDVASDHADVRSFGKVTEDRLEDGDVSRMPLGHDDEKRPAVEIGNA
jgi:hypothetical protein